MGSSKWPIHTWTHFPGGIWTFLRNRTDWVLFKNLKENKSYSWESFWREKSSSLNRGEDCETQINWALWHHCSVVLRVEFWWVGENPVELVITPCHFTVNFALCQGRSIPGENLYWNCSFSSNMLELLSEDMVVSHYFLQWPLLLLGECGEAIKNSLWHSLVWLPLILCSWEKQAEHSFLYKKAIWALEGRCCGFD